jgi:cell wall-associated NlpC family hydrolase
MIFINLHNMNERLGIRKGFLVGALAGFFVAGSLLWSIPAVTSFMPQVAPESAFRTDLVLPVVREAVPNELAWFFIQYPYISAKATLRYKNRHAAIVSDPERSKEYVLQFGQRFRRVEVYAKGQSESQVHVYTPGSKRVVNLRRGLISSEATHPEANLWMWKSPLWNERHLHIYTQVDQWLNSPFKRYSCAGFVHKFLKDSNVQVPILDAWDMAKLPWRKITKDELEPGDIITLKANSAEHRRFWGHRITHVGVYIGNGKFIHASTPSRKAKRSWIRVAELHDFRHRFDKAIRPPDLL